MFGGRRRKRLVAQHVKGYQEGRRLMRQGDGADEWVGMDMVRLHLRALVSLGYDQHGQKHTEPELDRILAEHRLSRDKA